MEDEKKVGDTLSPEERPTDAALPVSASDTEDTEYLEPEIHQGDTQTPAEGNTPKESLSSDTPPSSVQADPPPVDKDRLKQIEGRLESIVGTEQRLFSEVREMHKLYHSEFAGRLKAMQDELEQYRKIDKGRAYDDILAAIARIYGNNETLADEVTEPKVKKSIRYMLMDIEDLLAAYGMEKLRSEEGEKRNPRHCQVLNRIPTDDFSKHDTVAKSYNSGFFIGNRTITKEMVDIFIYDGQMPVYKAEEDRNNGVGDTPVTE